jgi:hypothetical protein
MDQIAERIRQDDFRRDDFLSLIAQIHTAPLKSVFSCIVAYINHAPFSCIHIPPFRRRGRDHYLTLLYNLYLYPTLKKPRLALFQRFHYQLHKDPQYREERGKINQWDEPFLLQEGPWNFDGDMFCQLYRRLDPHNQRLLLEEAPRYQIPNCYFQPLTELEEEVIIQVCSHNLAVDPTSLALFINQCSLRGTFEIGVERPNDINMGKLEKSHRLEIWRAHGVHKLRKLVEYNMSLRELIDQEVETIATDYKGLKAILPVKTVYSPAPIEDDKWRGVLADKSCFINIGGWNEEAVPCEVDYIPDLLVELPQNGDKASFKACEGFCDRYTEIHYLFGESGTNNDNKNYELIIESLPDPEHLKQPITRKRLNVTLLMIHEFPPRLHEAAQGEAGRTVFFCYY